MGEIKEAVNDILLGIPTLALLPAKQFKFKVSDDKYMFKIPNKGLYKEIDSEFFADDEATFEVYSDNIVNISVITKILFATRQYPALEDNQLFCPINFSLDGEEVKIYGQVVTMLGADDA